MCASGEELLPTGACSIKGADTEKCIRSIRLGILRHSDLYRLIYSPLFIYRNENAGLYATQNEIHYEWALSRRVMATYAFVCTILNGSSFIIQKHSAK
jgi:hypothetical protein